jgi:hypothetical protein
MAYASEEYGYCNIAFHSTNNFINILENDSKDAKICYPLVSTTRLNTTVCPISWHFKQYAGYHTVSTSLGDLLNSNDLPENTKIILKSHGIKSLTNISHKIYYGTNKGQLLLYSIELENSIPGPPQFATGEYYEGQITLKLKSDLYCGEAVCQVSDEESLPGKFPISSFAKIEGNACAD